MMNIEKLAIEHGAVHYSPPPMRAVKGLSFTFEQLEAFAKALKSSEPFGYFKAEPFGWTDCAESDEGAIALYE